MVHSPRVLAAVLALSAGFAGTARPEAAPTESTPTFTGTIALATKYISRGLDISEGPPVPQAGFEYTNPIGVYVDGYAAKIRYFGMNAEIDGNVGYRGQHGRVNYDFGLYYYYYPRANPALHSNFAEFGAKLTWGDGPLTPVLEAYVSNNYFFGAGESFFVWSGADLALPEHLTLSARIGYLTVQDNRSFLYPDYATWMLSAAKQLASYSFSIQVTDTSMNRSECTDGPRCAVKLTLKIAKSF